MLLSSVGDWFTYFKKKFFGGFSFLSGFDNSDQDICFYRCSECGYCSFSIGFLHAHMESHTGWFSVANVDKFMDWTEKVWVRQKDVTGLDSLEGERM